MSDTTTDLSLLDATAQAGLVRDGEASPAELVDAAIDRVEELNGELNAVIREQFDAAREQASGELPDGPFKGVPLLVKDLGPIVAGQQLHMGMKVLKEAQFAAPLTSWLSERMIDAGFISLGQTNTPELGLVGTTEPEAYGPTRNPWNTDYSTLGSSGGSAAAVASGMVPLAHANDGGGSIRLPASANGLVGLKPTRGRVTMGPVIGDSLGGMTADLCVSRTVRDTAAFLDAVHGPGPGDPYWPEPPVRPYVEELETEPDKLRIALITDTGAEIDLDPEMVELTEGSARELEGLGHVVEPQEPIEMGGRMMVETFTLMWAAGAGATLDQLSILIGRPITADDVEPVTWALAEGGRAKSAAELLTARGHHQTLGRMMAFFMDGGGYDLIMTPTVGALPPKIGERDQRGVEDPMDVFSSLRADRWIHRPVQRHGPARDQPADEDQRVRAACRHPADRANGPRGSADQDRSPDRAGIPLVGTDSRPSRRPRRPPPYT